RIGRHYFANPEARSLALGFYHKLSSLCEQGAHDQVYETVRRYRSKSASGAPRSTALATAVFLKAVKAGIQCSALPLFVYAVPAH
ncbi:hypothetical protein MJN76_33210, partial [Salmonella enterica subsp. enterica serovar Anatum]|nr:hypothetical protein [Salmonella enterica subsp. enterica serovar Anatum]